MEFDVGDIVDVESVDIFYPAIIVSIHYAYANGSSSSSVSTTAQRYSSSSLSHIIVHYFGWEARYDEKLSADELSTRVFPGGMYVKKYKVWTYLSPSYPVWPCYLYIRPAKDGNKDAVKFLKKETLMLIIPYGTSLSCMKDIPQAGATMQPGLAQTIGKQVKIPPPNSLKPPRQPACIQAPKHLVYLPGRK